MNSKEFNKWAKDMIKKVDYRRLYTYRIPDDLRTVVCYDKKIGKVGVARCHPNDKFNLVWGKAIATARCLGIEVPKISIYKKLNEMKNGDIFADGLNTYFFIGECKNYQGNRGFAVQNIQSNKIVTMTTNCVVYEMVE